MSSMKRLIISLVASSLYGSLMFYFVNEFPVGSTVPSNVFTGLMAAVAAWFATQEVFRIKDANTAFKKRLQETGKN